MNSFIDLDQIPFYWRTKPTTDSSPTHIPQRLPFRFTFDPQNQLLIQERKPEVLDALDKVYRENQNVGYLQEGSIHASTYGGDFLRFITLNLDEGRHGAAVTEIGCGGCYILQKLRQDFNMDVKGVDPSPVAVEFGKALKIPIIDDFYPSRNPISKSDVILHYDVLEHVEDPVSFLKSHHNDLNYNGIVIFAVPDCTTYIEDGDVSMVLHEHLNYFDSDSLRITVERAGFEVLNLERSKYGGVLYCAAQPSKKIYSHSDTDWQKFNRYSNQYSNLSAKLRSLTNDINSSPGASLGLYVPLRALPYLSNLNSVRRMRFFDDDPALKGKYYDGCDIPIENFQDLCKNSPSHILICSFSFGDKIVSKIRAAGLASKILTLKEIADTKS